MCALKDLQACTRNAACAGNNCVIYYADQDGDGWGNTANPIRVCNEANAAAPPGFSTRPGDCCDTDNSAHPGADSTYWPTVNACGSFDYDCDGVIEQLYPNVTCAATSGGCAITTSSRSELRPRCSWRITTCWRRRRRPPMTTAPGQGAELGRMRTGSPRSLPR